MHKVLNDNVSSNFVNIEFLIKIENHKQKKKHNWFKIWFRFSCY
jgi:general stress protein 26